MRTSCAIIAREVRIVSTQTNVEVFDELVGELDYPMYVVTATSGGERSGCLVGFASQCSIDPSRFVVWISKRNHTYRVARDGTDLAVHVLRQNDLELAELFGEATGDEVDKFAECAWHDGPGGLAIIDGCDWFVGRVLVTVDGGDHVGFVLEPTAAERRPRAFPQLGYQSVRDLSPGHDA
jgi:flavin reductase (DIM6/NTAB) family NADH-FMN oxidoreductase RutF